MGRSFTAIFAFQNLMIGAWIGRFSSLGEAIPEMAVVGLIDALIVGLALENPGRRADLHKVGALEGFPELLEGQKPPNSGDRPKRGW